MLILLPTPNDKKVCVQSQNTRLSSKFILFKDINFECLFTLCILGLEAYLIEPSFFFKRGSFTSDAGAWKTWTAQRGYSSETTQCSSDFGKTRFYCSRVEGLGKRREKEIDLDGKSRRNPWRDEALAAKKRGVANSASKNCCPSPISKILTLLSATPCDLAFQGLNKAGEKMWWFCYP